MITMKKSLFLLSGVMFLLIVCLTCKNEGLPQNQEPLLDSLTVITTSGDTINLAKVRDGYFELNNGENAIHGVTLMVRNNHFNSQQVNGHYESQLIEGKYYLMMEGPLFGKEQITIQKIIW